MAILKHLSSKSANYGRAVEYLMYEQDRLTNRSIEDENGRLIMRENFIIDSLDCNVSTFDAECRMLNNRYHKNQKYGDIKSHHYIISFDPKDAVEGKLTMKDAQQIGMEYAERNFPGHQAIVCTHDDGEHGSGNIHVHVIFNSLRKRDVKRRYFMERKIDCRAGYKHHLTDKHLEYLKIDLMDVCKRKKLHQVDLKKPAKKRVTEKEYWASVRRKEAKGNKFATDKDRLRSAIENVSAKCKSEKEFASILKDKYKITFKISRGRYSYILPNRKKAIRGRSLGTNYTEEYLRPKFRENLRVKENAKSKESARPQSKTKHDRHTNNKVQMHKAAKVSDTTRIMKPQEHTVNSSTTSNQKPKPARVNKRKYPEAFTMDTRLPFVRDLQSSDITTTNRLRDRNIKVTNLKEMADTIMYMEEHGIESRDALDSLYQDARDKLYNSRSALKSSEDGIKALNEQIHHTGQYLAHKSVYTAYLNARNKERFRTEHRADIILFEAARRYLKENANERTLPSLKYIKTPRGHFVSLDRLKSKRSELISEQKELRSRYYSDKNAEKELYKIKKNVDNMLREPSLERQRMRTWGIER